MRTRVEGHRRLRRRLVTLAAVAALGACGSSGASIGPLSLDVPEGWSITGSGSPNNLQIANGTVASDTSTRAGTATAVFDIYVETATDAEEYREQLRSDNVGVREERETIDGEEVIVLTYAGPATAGRQIAYFFPAQKIQIVYRAAYPNDDAAFFSGRGAFLRAVRSITFSS